ncbi:potassium/proton antiporter [Spectribacter hydrogenoxidans]|uniref:Potassium/proton antiporter n=1 Tax=Spectribacter hydrogenoxidans TaxID=3075608 RepID=A0ABU3BXI3_9GAMM|nr:potassium/proton antiporter [Salinisphaera sp. W335]MDT0634021.1 potassium/proton antiporter [Salinisphaera sp. W335]
MDAINTLLLFAGLLLFLSVVATPLSRFGFPLLLIFLGVGMLAGEDGPGQIDFDDFSVAFLVGNLALAVILLDGGLRTRYQTFRVALKPALSLASLGVVLCAGLTGGFIAWLLDVDWRYGLLLGSIVGSTDAAAVFSQLRQGGMALNQRVSATLEIESGTNDPMAIFLVLFLLQALTSDAELTWLHLLQGLLLQFGIGALAGVGLGFALSWLVERIPLVEGLYALLIVSGGLITFSAINQVGGSGFLGVYLLGLVVGNRPNHATEHVFRVMDGLAWLAQAGMFLILGLLVTPSELMMNALPASLIALFLIFVARPIAVFVSLAPFHFPWREQLFIAWVGLRGAVPVVLAIFPLMAALTGARFLFDITFAVVIVSLLLQGTTIALAARLLGLQVPEPGRPLDQTELHGGGRLRFMLSLFRVEPGSRFENRPIEALPQARRVRWLAVLRGKRFLFPGRHFRLRADDRVYLAHPARHTDWLAGQFRAETGLSDISPRRFYGNFILHGESPMRALATMYGIELEGTERDLTLDEFIRQHLNRKAVAGDSIKLAHIGLRVRSVDGRGRITTAGLRIRDQAAKT